MKLIHDGKTKRVYDSGKTLTLEFKDTILGHQDGTPDPGGNFVVGREQGKSRVACVTSVYFFQLLEKNGVSTHFLRLVSPKKIEVIKTRPIPLEVIYRRLAYGSFLRRYQPFVKPFAKLNLTEFTLKSDVLGDPFISDEVIQYLGIATRRELRRIKKLTNSIAQVLHNSFRAKSIGLVDFKVEFGRKGNELLIIDTLNADSMRILGPKKRLIDYLELAKRLGVTV